MQRLWAQLFVLRELYAYNHGRKQLLKVYAWKLDDHITTKYIESPQAHQIVSKRQKLVHLQTMYEGECEGKVEDYACKQGNVTKLRAYAETYLEMVCLIIA